MYRSVTLVVLSVLLSYGCADGTKMSTIEGGISPTPLMLHTLEPPPTFPPTPIMRVSTRPEAGVTEQPGVLIHVDWQIGQARERRDPGSLIPWPSPIIRPADAFAIVFRDVPGPEVGFVRVYEDLGPGGVPWGQPFFECRVTHVESAPGCVLESTDHSWGINIHVPIDSQYFVSFWAAWLIPGQQDRYTATWIFSTSGE